MHSPPESAPRSRSSAGQSAGRASVSPTPAAKPAKPPKPTPVPQFDSQEIGGRPDTPQNSSFYRYFCPICFHYFPGAINLTCCSNHCCAGCALLHIQRRGLTLSPEAVTAVAAARAHYAPLITAGGAAPPAGVDPAASAADNASSERSSAAPAAVTAAGGAATGGVAARSSLPSTRRSSAGDGGNTSNTSSGSYAAGSVDAALATRLIAAVPTPPLAVSCPMCSAEPVTFAPVLPSATPAAPPRCYKESPHTKGLLIARQRREQRETAGDDDNDDGGNDVCDGDEDGGGPGRQSRRARTTRLGGAGVNGAGTGTGATVAGGQRAHETDRGDVPRFILGGTDHDAATGAGYGDGDDDHGASKVRDGVGRAFVLAESRSASSFAGPRLSRLISSDMPDAHPGVAPSAPANDGEGEGPVDDEDATVAAAMRAAHDDPDLVGSDSDADAYADADAAALAGGPPLGDNYDDSDDGDGGLVRGASSSAVLAATVPRLDFSRAFASGAHHDGAAAPALPEMAAMSAFEHSLAAVEDEPADGSIIARLGRAGNDAFFDGPHKAGGGGGSQAAGPPQGENAVRAHLVGLMADDDDE